MALAARFSGRHAYPRLLVTRDCWRSEFAGLCRLVKKRKKLPKREQEKLTTADFLDYCPKII